MDKLFGIDVSKWQGNFNFKKAKDEGVKFAILRAGYTGSSNGTSKAKDEKFETYYKNAKKNGIHVGAYWFSRATTYKNGQAEAEYMYNNCLKGKQFEYPIAIDVEDTKYQQKAGKKQVTEAIKGFCEYLEEKGYYVCIYANSNWFKNYIDTENLIQYDKWLANWSKSNPSSPAHGLWQFGASTNKIRSNKIAGVTCDQDYAYKDYPKIMRDKGLNGFTKATTEEKPKETTQYYPKCTYKGTSIVEGLISIKVDSSYSHREKIAKANGISGYKGSASQNTQMLNLLKQGKLKRV